MPLPTLGPGGGAPAGGTPSVVPQSVGGSTPYGTIGGPLNFGGMGSAAYQDFSGNPAGLTASYANSYNAALNLNAQNYSNILSGYQKTAGNLGAAGQSIGQGYNQLQQNVLGTIQGISASQKQAIEDAYAQQTGSAMQGLISRGLGNTTVQNSVSRGLMLDKQKADIALSNQTAQLTAGYQSNLGLAGLNYQNQAALQNAGQANQQLGWMNSVNAPYPDAGMYAQLAQQYGAAQQAQANRDLQSQLADKMMAASRLRGGGGGGGGYVPSGGGFMPPQSFGGTAAPAPYANMGPAQPTGGAPSYSWDGGTQAAPPEDYGAYGWAGGPSLDTGNGFSAVGGYASDPYADYAETEF